MRMKTPSYLLFTCTPALPRLRHLSLSDLSMMMVPVQGKVGPSYKCMAMARHVNSRRYTDLLIPLVPVQGKVGPSYQCMAMAHHVVNSRRYIHRPPHTSAHTSLYPWAHHVNSRRYTDLLIPMCIHGLYTRRYTPPRTSHRVHAYGLHQGVYTHLLIHINEHTWLKYACTTYAETSQHPSAYTNLHIRQAHKLIKHTLSNIISNAAADDEPTSWEEHTSMGMDPLALQELAELLPGIRIAYMFKQSWCQ